MGKKMMYSVETLPRMDAEIKRKVDLHTNQTIKGKITFEQQPIMPEGNLNGTNYLMVYGTGTPTENAAELQAAYNEAKKMPRYLGTINFGVVATVYKGQAYTIGGPGVTLLSKTDYTGIIQNQPIGDRENITLDIAKSIRTTVIVAPGEYLVQGRFTLDIMNIDVVSLTGNPDVEIPDTYISSSTTIRGIVSDFTLNHTMSYQPPTIIDCVGGFYAEYNNYATYIRCTGTTDISFGSEMGFSGVARDCRMLVGNFPTNAGGGKVYNCINGDGTLVNHPLPIFADNAAAASLPIGTMYRTATGVQMIKY